MSDFFSRLDSDPPKAWIFKEDGPKIFGVCRGIEEGMTRDYGPCPVVTLELDDGYHKPEDGVERSVWAFHDVLERELARAKPNVGERIGIKWLGRKHPEGGGREYESYRVIIDRKDGEAAFDWSNYGHHTETSHRNETTEVESEDGPDDAPF